MKPVDYRKNKAPKYRQPKMFDIVDVVRQLPDIDAVLYALINEFKNSKIVMRSIMEAEKRGYIKRGQVQDEYEVTAKGMEFYTKEHV